MSEALRETQRARDYVRRDGSGGRATALPLLWSNWGEMCQFAGVGRLEAGQPMGVLVNGNETIGLAIPGSAGVTVATEGSYVFRAPPSAGLFVLTAKQFHARYAPVDATESATRAEPPGDVLRDPEHRAAPPREEIR